MESLEALKKIFFDNKDLKVDITLNDRKVCEIYNIIKQDLERLEKLEQENRNLVHEIDFKYKENEKLKQALDILKRFNFEYQFDCYYLVANDRTAIRATLEELQLVKEVLGNE